MAFNGPELDWDTARGDIQRGKYEDQALEKNELLAMANQLIATPGRCNTAELLLHSSNISSGRAYAIDHDLVAQALVRTLPVLGIKFGNAWLLVDVHTVHGEAGEWLASIVEPEGIPDIARKAQEHLSQLEEGPIVTPSFLPPKTISVEKTAQHQKNGRHAYHKKWPDLVKETLNYITANSFSAQERRRSATFNIGVTLPAIRKHLYEAIPGLKQAGIDVRTIRHLMVPPNESVRSAARYFRLINANIPSKRNDVRKINKDGHWTMAAVKLLEELFMLFPDETAMLSADRKQKIKVEAE